VPEDGPRPYMRYGSFRYLIHRGNTPASLGMGPAHPSGLRTTFLNQDLRTPVSEMLATIPLPECDVAAHPTQSRPLNCLRERPGSSLFA
jgi:hypothetical protein